MLEHRRPSGDRWKVQYLRAEVGAAVIVAGDITVLGACIFALWLTHATSDVVAAALTSAFAAIASMTSAYFGIRAVSNVVQGQQAQVPEGGAEPKSGTTPENAATAPLPRAA
jgi:hypothetical protein